MKTITLATLAFAASTGVALAGNLETPAPIVAPAVEANDWGGFYLGGMAASDSGVARALFSGVPGPDFPFSAGNVYGAFAGYNIQNGSIVYGAELAYTVSNIGTVAIPGSIQQFYGDAKLRAGYSIGKAMAYASAGYSFGSFDDNGAGIFTQSGWVAGIGVDVMVTDHMFVGLEYSMRDIAGPAAVPTTEIQSEIQSVALRAGWNF